MDTTKYFRGSENTRLDGRALNVSIPGCSSSSQLSAASKLRSLQEIQGERKKRQILPDKVENDIAYYAWKHGTPEARRWASKKYPNFTFKRETVRDWKTKYMWNFSKYRGADFFTLPRPGRPPVVSDEIVTEVKAILHNLRVCGSAITRKTVLTIGNGVLSSRCPDKLARNCGNITLTEKRGKKYLEVYGLG